jgi:hypothetical protein
MPTQVKATFDKLKGNSFGLKGKAELTREELSIEGPSGN